MTSDKTVLMLLDARTNSYYCTACADGTPLGPYDETDHALGRPHGADTVMVRRQDGIRALNMVLGGVAVSGGAAIAMAMRGNAWEAVADRTVLILLDTQTDYYYCAECADGIILGHPPRGDDPYITPYDIEEVLEHALEKPHRARTAVIQKADGIKSVRFVLEVMWRSNAPDMEAAA